MPTKRRRITITETEEVTRLLQIADRAWPEEDGVPSRLLRRLILAGHERIKREMAEEGKA